MDSGALGPVDPDERVEVSVILRPREPLPEPSAGLSTPMTREEFAAAYGANPDDVAAVEAFARRNGLEVVESSQPRRTIRLAGRAVDMSRAFGIELHRHRLEDGTEYRAPTREVQLSGELQGRVEAVFGLDTRPIAQQRKLVNLRPA